MNTVIRILFLDFDGVLHRPNCLSEDQLVHLPHLEKLLQDHADVRLVISSSWRVMRSVDSALSAFPHGLRQRVIGDTPVLRAEGGQWHRQRECEAWLKEHAPAAIWLGIDDEAQLFEPGKAVICNPALGLADPKVRSEIEQWLVATDPSPSSSVGDPGGPR
ncbi:MULTISPECIES: HAD domain-containing protein [unclassified Variovorax]|uniref:HAD domain-containing protein n=1 Tax=Variovorax sp. Sphag1AA TaxID=2587027 RepID=UPI0016210368